MNTPTPPSPHPLTPEERALAARLARLGPHGMPPPALDASILGAAHAAASRQAHKRPRRWPALLGLAATLALAIGVTWQMQPRMEPVAQDEAPRAGTPAAITETASGDSAAAAVPAATEVEAGRQPVAPATEAFPAPEPPSARGPTAAEPTPAAAPVMAPARPAASSLSAPPPAPPSAPPAPASAPPATAEKALAPATAAQAARDPTPRRMQDTGARSQAVDAREGLANAIGAPESAQDLASTPVAGDRSLAPADWIERIRLRRDAGDLAAARASLQLLRSAHPRQVLPEDLRELADSYGDLP